MNVADAMTPRSELVVARLPGNRDDALSYIREHGFSSVPVVKDADGEEIYRGLVSRTDLIANPEEDQLALLMREVPTVAPDDSIRDAARTALERDARRLPVLEDGALAGILTVTDIVRAIAHEEVDGGVPVGELATEEVNATYVGTPLAVAEREIALARLPYAVCLDDRGEMAGILTEVDVLEVARVVEGEENTGGNFGDQDDDWKWERVKGVGGRYLPTRNVRIPAEPVEEFMTAEPITVGRRRTATDAAREMISNDVEQLPLVVAGDLAGVVRDVNLLEGLS